MSTDKDPSREAFEEFAASIDTPASMTGWVFWQASRKVALEDAMQACDSQMTNPDSSWASCKNAVKDLK